MAERQLITYVAYNRRGEMASLTWYQQEGAPYWTHCFRVWGISPYSYRSASGGLMSWDPWHSTDNAVASSAWHTQWSME